MKKNIYQTGIGISLEFDSINTKLGFSLPEPSWLIMSVSVKSARSITFCDKKQPTVLSIIRTAWCHFVIVVKRNHTGGSQVVRWPLIPRILATENCLPTLQIASVGAGEHVLVVLQSWSLRHCYHRATLTIRLRCSGGSNPRTRTTLSSLVSSRPPWCSEGVDFSHLIIKNWL